MSTDHELRLERRKLLHLGVTVASGILLPASVQSNRRESPSEVHPLHTFVQPPVLAAKNGVLDLRLTATYWQTTLASADPKHRHSVSLRAYAYDANGPSYAGPTLVVRGGDHLRILLVNHLPVNPTFQAFRDPTNYMKPNTTNLHLHGLHVSPEIDADKRPLEYGDYVVDPNSGGVRPNGDHRQYAYKIPKDHPAGPFYYHPQYHGSSALQVASLMTGAIMVRGPVDNVPEMAQAKELIFLFQAPYFATSDRKQNHGVSDGSLEKFSQIANQPTGHGIHPAKPGEIEIQPVLINGVRQPTIVLESGEVQRWRFINTQVFNFLHLSLEEHSFYQYTMDGWGSPTYQEYSENGRSNRQGIVLAAGNRASVLVKAGRAGTYYLRSLPVPVAKGKQTVLAVGDILAKIVVLPDKKVMALPRAPLPVSPFLEPISDQEFACAGGKKRSIIFNLLGNDHLAASNPETSVLDAAIQDATAFASVIQESVTEGIKKNIAFAKEQLSQVTGQAISGSKYFPPFVPPRYDYQLQPANSMIQQVLLNAVEEWTIFNCNSAAQVFHIHVNPMYIMKINGLAVPPYWCDTVALPSGGTQEIPTSVTFRMRFNDFTGPYTLHSQLLRDADLGMVQRVTVLPI